MPDHADTSPTRLSDEFQHEVDSAPSGLLREYVDFLRHNKKWWLAPIFLALLVAGAAVITSGTAAAPFIYALF